MQVRAEQIKEQLGLGLKPVYLISGDEPLQVMEVADAVRAAAKQQGFSERDLLNVDPQFDWSLLLAASEALSLFSQQKLLDMRLHSCKIGAAGSKALQQYLAYPPTDKLLLIQAGRLDKACRAAAWVKAIEQHGVLVQVWDLSPPQALAWLAKRMREADLKPTEAAVRYLAEHVEGNLLAAVQEINKLKLLYPNEALSLEQMAAAISDSSRFTVFDLADAILAQDLKRLQHILQVLKDEDTALPLLVWALGDLLRQLYEVGENQRHQRSNQALIMRLPKNRQGPFQAAVKRMERANWPSLFKRLAVLDQHSKGVGTDVSRHPERLWDDVFDMALALMGKRLFAV